jgi:hypothetical protein
MKKHQQRTSAAPRRQLINIKFPKTKNSNANDNIRMNRIGEGILGGWNGAVMTKGIENVAGKKTKKRMMGERR